MNPSSLSIPTDNIYKFGCIFGLALIISSVISFVSVYTASLEKKVAYSEIIIKLKVKSYRTTPEKEILTLNERLLEITKNNEDFANKVFGVLAGLGVSLSFSAFSQWYRVIQKRDDRVADLQLEKLELEIRQVKAELRRLNLSRYQHSKR